MGKPGYVPCYQLGRQSGIAVIITELFHDRIVEAFTDSDDNLLMSTVFSHGTAIKMNNRQLFKIEVSLALQAMANG